MAQKPIQLVCFDLGGVFLRLSDSWDDALRRAGVDQASVREGFDQDPAFGQANDLFERGQIDESLYAQRMAAVTGLNPTDMLATLDAWLLGPYHGIERLLDALAQTGVRTACLSNTNDRHWRAITQHGPQSLPLHRLDHCFASHLISHRKPDARAYQHVQEITATPAKAILYFDDSHGNCHAANASGWNAHRVDPEGDPIAQILIHLDQCGLL